jgi:hypothetical protein
VPDDVTIRGDDWWRDTDCPTCGGRGPLAHMQSCSHPDCPMKEGGAPGSTTPQGRVPGTSAAERTVATFSLTEKDRRDLQRVDACLMSHVHDKRPCSHPECFVCNDLR